LTDKQARRSRAIARLGLWSAYPARTRPVTPAARVAPPLVAVAVLLAVWWALAQVTPVVLLPDPIDVVGRVWRWVGASIGWRYAWPTLAAALLGSGLALVVALPLGFIVAHSRLLGAVIEPFIAFSQTVPLVAVAPLLVLWVGYGTTPIAMLCAIIAFFPMVTTTVVGLRSLDMRIIETAWLDGADAWQRLIHLEVPVAAPAILAGVRGGVVLSMTGAIVGEFVMGGEGLGTLLTISREAADTTGVFAVLILIAVMAAALVALLSVLERAAISNLQGEHS
jgi:ABC transporter, permease protein